MLAKSGEDSVMARPPAAAIRRVSSARPAMGAYIKRGLLLDAMVSNSIRYHQCSNGILCINWVGMSTFSVQFIISCDNM